MSTDSDGWHGWQIFALASIPGFGAWVWAAYQFFLNRKDKKSGEEKTYEQKMKEDLLEQRKTLNADQALLFERIRAEWMRSTRRNDQLQMELDRAWELVRYWHRFSESLLHQLNNQRSVSDGLALKAGIILDPWVKIYLPDMENPEEPTPAPPGTGGRGAGLPPPKPLEKSHEGQP
jgi:hypothetical protein